MITNACTVKWRELEPSVRHFSAFISIIKWWWQFLRKYGNYFTYHRLSKLKMHLDSATAINKNWMANQLATSCFWRVVGILPLLFRESGPRKLYPMLDYLNLNLEWTTLLLSIFKLTFGTLNQYEPLWVVHSAVLYKYDLCSVKTQVALVLALQINSEDQYYYEICLMNSLILGCAYCLL